MCVRNGASFAAYPKSRAYQGTISAARAAVADVRTLLRLRSTACALTMILRTRGNAGKRLGRRTLARLFDWITYMCTI